MSPSLAETIRAQREGKGLTQQALAELLELPTSTVSSWETGARKPRAYRLTSIEEALGLPNGALVSAFMAASVKL